jgi:PAS domain S-box-containing protein
MNVQPLQDCPTVLVVDDDKLTRLQLRRAMEQLGYQVTEAENGEQALTAYIQSLPDLVLLDAIMPVLDGFTCCRKMRSHLAGDRTPILIVTALEDQESVDLAFAAGATDYITKPIHWAVLRQRVRQLLQTSKALTELQSQKQQAELQEKQLRLALEAAHMGTWDWNIVTNEVVYCHQLKLIFGFSADIFDRNYKDFLSRVYPPDRDRVNRAINEAIEGGKEYELEFRIVCSDGSIKWLGSKGQVYRDSQGKPLRMIGISMDITARQLAQEQLQSQETLLRSMTSASPLAFYVVDNRTDEILYFNHRFCEIWGIEHLEAALTKGELKNNDIIPECIKVLANVPAFVESCKPLQNEASNSIVEDEIAFTYDRTIRRFSTQIRDRQNHYFGRLYLFEDITERKRAEFAIKQAQKRSQLFSEITLKIRQSLHLDEVLRTAVTELLNLLKADRALIFRLSPDGNGKIVTEAVVSDYSSVVKQNITEECFGQEYLKKYRQGRIYKIDDVEKSGVEPCLIEFMQRFDVKAKLVMPILLKEELWGLTIVHQCSHPRTWTDFEIELLRQLADQIGIALAQAQLLEEETRQRQELARSNAELQQFAYIASHDLQEPLRKIQAFSNRLKEKCSASLDNQGRDYIERMHSAAERMQALINDLLILSQITTKAQPFVLVDLNQVTHEVISDLELRIHQTGGCVQVGELPTIAADPLQIHQLLQNLIGNALKFHRQGEAPIVKVNGQILEREQHFVAGLANTAICQITIEDNGIGFEEKYLDRIFDVFQRLHGRNEYEGTGMGLAICRKIVERHGGSLTAQSTPMQGAKFIVTLPVK